MKKLFFILGFISSFFVNAQSKGKIIPVDKSILKLNEDTLEIVTNKKTFSDFDYAIVLNKETNKKDTVIVYKDYFYTDKKRKTKN